MEADVAVDKPRNRSVAMLRGYHGSQTAAEATRRLGIEPTSTQAAEEYSSFLSGPTGIAGWFYEVEASGARGGPSAIELLCERLAQKQTELRALHAAGWAFDVVLRWPHVGLGGPTFSPEVMQCLSRLGLSVWVMIISSEAT